MELMSVCHTVIPEKVGNDLVYQAASPGILSSFIVFNVYLIA